MGKIRLFVVSSLLVPFLACSGGGEQQVVGTYLNAVKGGDKAAASFVSLVEFPGEVSSWEIVEVGEESQEPFNLPSVRAEFQEMEAAVEAKTESNDAFVQLHADEYREVRSRLEKDPDYEFKGALLEFKTELDQKLKEHEQMSAKLEELRAKVIALRDAAGLSLNTSVNDNFEGQVKGKVVVLKVNDGSEDKTYNLKLQRFELSDTERNITPMPRWIVTEVREKA